MKCLTGSYVFAPCCWAVALKGALPAAGVDGKEPEEREVRIKGRKAEKKKKTRRRRGTRRGRSPEEEKK